MEHGRLGGRGVEGGEDPQAEGISVLINPRFNGPPESANGGYTCGMLAKACLAPQSAAEVTLRRPPPLGQTMELRNGCLWHGDLLIAEVRGSDLDLEVPEPPSLEVASRSGRHFHGLQDHPFPTCFVCGPGRPAHDGLALFAGPVEGRDLVATVWTPAADLAGPDGLLPEEFLWCALDCPGAWSLDQKMEYPMLLGRLTARIDGGLRAGRPAVVMGWPLGRQGRKAFAGTAVVDEAGRVIARAKAVWITVSV